jgi:hypothetical protein
VTSIRAKFSAPKKRWILIDDECVTLNAPYGQPGSFFLPLRCSMLFEAVTAAELPPPKYRVGLTLPL